MHGNGWKRALFGREHIVGSCLHQQRQRKGHRESLAAGDGTSQDGSVLGSDGTAWVESGIWDRLSGVGYRKNESRDGHAGNVGSGTLLVEFAFARVPLWFLYVPCVPRGARLVCWRLLCWRQLRLPFSGYRGAFLSPHLTRALVQTGSKVWPLVAV